MNSDSRPILRKRITRRAETQQRSRGPGACVRTHFNDGLNDEVGTGDCLNFVTALKIISE